MACSHGCSPGSRAAEKQRRRPPRPQAREPPGHRASGNVQIADFGIAKALDRRRRMEFKTATGHDSRTPAYIAPEQALGQDIAPATDLYSVGVMAYEMLVGRLPFHEPTRRSRWS